MIRFDSVPFTLGNCELKASGQAVMNTGLKILVIHVRRQANKVFPSLAFAGHKSWQRHFLALVVCKRQSCHTSPRYIQVPTSTYLPTMEDDIQALRKQLSFCRRIEIISMTANGSSVLAQGQLEDGTYENGGNWFRVQLMGPEELQLQEEVKEKQGGGEFTDILIHDDIPNAEPTTESTTTATEEAPAAEEAPAGEERPATEPAPAASCPLTDLCHLRITVGGLHQGQLSSITDFRTDYDFPLGNSEDSKGLLLTAQSQQLALHMVIHGWPSTDWGGNMGALDHHVITASSSQDALDYLSVTLPQRYPDATVSFSAVYLFSDINMGVIRNLPARVRAQLEQGLEESQSQFLFLKLITNRLRFVMDEDDTEALVPQVERVKNALAMLDIMSMEDLKTTQTKETMEYIIQMHKISRETGPQGTFEACVNGLLLQKQQKEERKRHQTMTTL